MAKLVNISISGIRSFGISKEDTQTIKFYSPLTLFLGENGCGKTTIIEAIKCCVTGDLPGGTNCGAGFIADPAMHLTASVTAHIKLSMLGPQNQQILITKIMRSEKKKNGGLKFSTLDSILKIIKQGEVETTGSRCFNIHESIYANLKVPKSILNNVIFCHQENSLWPLDENAKLKLKFDEIFESTEYTKCVEDFRKMFKESKVQIEQLKQDYQRKKLDNEKVDEKKRVLADKINKKNELQLVVNAKESEIEPIRQRLTEIAKLQDELIGLNRECATFENQIRNFEENEASLLENIKNELTGSDDELQHKLNRFNDNKNQEEGKINDLEAQKNAIVKKERELTEAVQKKTANCVKIKEKVAQYKNKLQERNLLINQLATLLNVRVGLKTDEEINTSVNALKQGVNVARNAVTNLNKEHEQMDKDLQKKVDECRNKLVQMEENIKIKKEQIVELKQQSRTIDSQLRELNCSDEQLKKFQNKLLKVDANLSEINANFNAEKLASDIDATGQKIKKSEFDLDYMEREYKILEKNAMIQNDIDNNTENISKLEADLYKLNNLHYYSFNQLFPGGGKPENNLKSAIQTMLGEANATFKKINEKIASSQKNITTLETTKQHQSDKLVNLKFELSEAQKKVANLCETTPYESKCVEIKEKINKLQKARGQLNSGKVLYEKFIEDLAEKKCCPVCSTGFSNKANALKEIIATIEGKIEGIPKQLEKCEQDLESSQDLQARILHLKPFNDKIGEIQMQSIPALKNQISDIDKSISAEKATLQQLKRDTANPETAIRCSNNVIADCAIFDQNRTEIARINAKLTQLNIKLIEVISNRTKQQCDTIILNAKSDLSNFRQDYERQTKKLNQTRERLHELNKEKNEIKAQQLSMEKLMQGKPQLLQSLGEIGEKLGRIEADLARFEAAVDELEANVGDAELNRDLCKETSKNEIALERQSLNKFENNLGDINKIQAIIASITNENLEANFNASLDEITQLNQRLHELDATKTNLVETINDLRIELANQEMKLRELKDNITLREKRKAHLLVSHELAQLQKKIGSKNATQITKEKDLLSRQFADMTRLMQKCYGQNEELGEIIKETTAELERPEYKNSKEICMDAYIALQVTDAAYKDIKMYGEALDNAIVVIHRKRMKQINEMIRTLWRQIYRGNDIDYVQIESGDTEFANTGKRNYNYRVMQMKNETMMEMRGRCSAGQKVLACLIIRMALSETFSANCGILALDEPTTNLDRSNIESLSQALADIIIAKSTSSSFQLLVITHDAQFIQTLRAVNAISKYYRVARDPRGVSLITSHDINKL